MIVRGFAGGIERCDCSEELLHGFCLRCGKFCIDPEIRRYARELAERVEKPD